MRRSRRSNLAVDRTEAVKSADLAALLIWLH
jgi:hypothetical protein